LEFVDEKSQVQHEVKANYVELFSALASRCWIGGRFGIPEGGKCQDAIITMNYDCLVDDCLVRFGVQPDYGLEHAELPTEFTQHLRSMPVFKLHGSANWFRCGSENCKSRIWFNPSGPAKRLEYFYGEGCSQCRHEIEPIIVPPTWAKGGQSKVLRPVWARALQALREAGRIFVIGYSMPSTDEFFRYMLALALATNENLDKVIVVNPSREAQETFATLFQSQFSARKLIPVHSTIENYIHDLGNELEQYRYGFEAGLIEASGIDLGN
jgi:NAD-dependent SIR2 family protein deacetylase